ncbi:MAG: LIC12162 family protein [Candidatus Wallbacteria bacterium]|nr:LIC12162 family protein [Candidatus Wallbacteria bacterium]
MPVYLATTALRDFWGPEDSETVLLGDWCLPDPEFSYRGKMKILPALWNDADQVTKAYYECRELYHIYLTAVTNHLNATHMINKNTKYYEIILGNWLLIYIHQIYEKFHSLEQAFSNLHEIQTLLLDPEDEVIPQDIGDFYRFVHFDSYQLQLYSRVCRGMKFSFPSKKCPTMQKIPIRQSAPLTKRSMISAKIATLFRWLSAFRGKKTVTLTEPYFCYQEHWKILSLILRSRFLFILDNFRYHNESNTRPDYSARAVKCGPSSTSLQNVLSESIMRDLPIIFLEGFTEYRDWIRKLPVKKSKIFCSAQGLHTLMPYKFYTAEYMGQSKTAYFQHGGGYGSSLVQFAQDYESSASSVFLTWGWDKPPNSLPLPHPKICCAKKSDYQKNSTFLFLMTGTPRYAVCFHYQYHSSNYFIHQNQLIDFFRLIIDNIEITVRKRPAEKKMLWWETEPILKKKYPHLKFQNPSIPFETSIDSAKCVITASLTTVHLETMARNIPTVIFFDPSIYRFTPEMDRFIQRMRSLGIVHDSGASAAAHINRFHGRMSEWWEQSDVQLLREEFVDQYARQCPDWQNEWIRFFRKMLKQGLPEND